MDFKKWVSVLGFTPKEGAVDVFVKHYPMHGGYHIDVDFAKKGICYNEIETDSKTTSNFSRLENFVVLECVDRLLSQGYSPKNIVLEKSYPAGRGSTKRLDILVLRDKQPYLMIECKTYGEEFVKELVNTQKTGGQLLTYFQQDTKAELLMLYASTLAGDKFVSEYRIIKIENELRDAGSVKEAYTRWSGTFYETGFWGKPPYDFEQEKFTKASSLRELNEAEGRALFNKFATILRRHSVSDKPNAFNKIFNLFLAKLYDEQKKPNDELEFHWRENDNPVDFQVRLFNLHKAGLKAFLDKELEGIDDSDFEGVSSREELLDKKKKVLKINKVYDIKEVFDDDTFEQNHRVLKDVVKLLEQYQIRYPRKQRHLSEFFEQLLTTGLKQEAGQFFTPPTVTKFIVRSLPLPQLLEREINQPAPTLPAALDYAAGSGHFITEILEEYQAIIEKLDTSDFFPNAQRDIAAWKAAPYSWAVRHIYGIEKDYRLVKVAKVGCYFYGDGLAQIILGDGLDSFEKSKSYVGLLKKNAKEPQFSVLVSNPPYSVDGVKDDIEYIGAQKEFALYNNLTDSSSEIEALFVERTAQLLKEGGVAGVVLPNTILSNGGIYAKAREIILQEFDIVAIAQLGGNTFMATNTNTVVLFLRKRNKTEVARIKEAAYRVAENYAQTHEDPTINGVEKPVKTYLEYTRETAVDPEKFYYFILSFHTRTVIVKTGEKDEEKNFLGYRIIKRRGSEGYHAIQSGKTIDECTKLYDDSLFDNAEKASTYIFSAFNGTFPAIHPLLKENVFYTDLVDLLTFDRDNFDKNVSLAVKKKVKFETKWEVVKLGEVARLIRGVTYNKGAQVNYATSNIILTADNITLDGQLEITKQIYLQPEMSLDDDKRLQRDDCFICCSSGSKMHVGKVAYIAYDTPYYAGGFMGILRRRIESILSKYLYSILNNPMVRDMIRESSSGSNINNLSRSLAEIRIPLPPLAVQQKIVAEIEALENTEAHSKKKIDGLLNEIHSIVNKLRGETTIKEQFHINNRSINPQEVWRDEYFTYVDIDAVGKGDGAIAFDKRILGKDAPSRARRLADSKTAIISTVRPYLKGFAFVDTVPDKTVFSTGFALLKSKSEDSYITKLIYLLFMFSDDLMQQMETSMPKASYPSINKEDIESLRIPLPSLAEQKKIVAEVEALEKEVTKAQDAIDKIPAQKAAILKKYL